MVHAADEKALQFHGMIAERGFRQLSRCAGIVRRHADMVPVFG